MRKITADKIYPVSSPPIDRGVIVVNDDGIIASVQEANAFDTSELEYFPGIIIPGFINTHCHLELSHMKGKVDTGTGLIPFITSVVRQRGADPEEIQSAIMSADQEMFEAGIMAVGDISNVRDTVDAKSKSQMRYYTFVEMFDFHQEQKAQETFDQCYQIFEKFNVRDDHKTSCAPHSPYTVSPELFAKITQVNHGPDHTISIHNQEMEPENALFRDKSGALLPFFESFGINLEHFEPTGEGAIMYAIQHMDPRHRNLFVHNTLTTPAEIAAAHAWSDRVYWATCPNANLYIENRLPDYQSFMNENATMTIGTDSLTSNWQLSILEEMKTIHRYQSYVPLEALIRWGTLNGAQALGFDDRLGSLEPGKAPGLCVLDLHPQATHLQSDTTVSRII